MTILLTITAILVLTFFTIKFMVAQQFKKQARELLTASLNISGRSYSHSQLGGLPEPVQRYFRHVLKEGQPYISSVRTTHHGFFKTDLKKDFIRITGEQYFSVLQPQFIWKGTTTLFTAFDSYVAQKGNLKVLLLGVFKVVDAKGPTLDEGELQRWLAESVWFPTNLLPSEHVKWTAIDKTTATLSFTYNMISFSYLVTFNDAGEIVQMETQRYMTGSQREKWICMMSNYAELNNIKIPLSAEAMWRLSTGDQSYARFEVRKIEYDIPKAF